MIATDPRCADSHDLVREYWVPDLGGLPEELAPPDPPVRYLTGIRCDRCGQRPLIDASKLDDPELDRLLAQAREP